MATETQADIEQRLDMRSKALAANSAELPQLEVTRGKVDSMLVQLKDLRAEQASLTAAKQEVTRRLVALLNEGQKLLTFVDAGIRAHYGTRSEKLVEFGLQPFRSQPRIRFIGPDGQPLKKGDLPSQRPAPAATPTPTPEGPTTATE